MVEIDIRVEIRANQLSCMVIELRLRMMFSLEYFLGFSFVKVNIN